MRMIEHKCFPDAMLRMSGDRPMDCYICGKHLSILKALRLEEDYLVAIGYLERFDDYKLKELKPINEGLDIIRKIFKVFKDGNRKNT